MAYFLVLYIWVKQFSFRKRQTDAARWQNVGAAQWAVGANPENNGWLPARSLPIVYGGTARNVESQFQFHNQLSETDLSE